jgi:hypothetical protein
MAFMAVFPSRDRIFSEIDGDDGRRAAAESRA